MWNRAVLRSAAAALSMMAVFADAADKSDKGGEGRLAKDDRNFVMEAAQGGMMEVQMGKLAQQNGQSDGVKQFAGQAVPTLEEHLKMARDLHSGTKGAAKGGSKGAEKGAN